MPTLRKRKCPHPTSFPFTKTRLLEEAERVKALSLDQVEFSCTVHRGMRAVIYASGRIKLYTRYSYRKRPHRIPLGELGLLTLEQARILHQRYRLQPLQGEDPKAPQVSNLTYRALNEEHYVAQCRARQKETLHTDLSRHANWLGPEFDDMPVASITKTHVSRFVLKLQEAGHLHERHPAPPAPSQSLRGIQTIPDRRLRRAWHLGGWGGPDQRDQRQPTAALDARARCH